MLTFYQSVHTCSVINLKGLVLFSLVITSTHGCVLLRLFSSLAGLLGNQVIFMKISTDIRWSLHLDSGDDDVNSGRQESVIFI